MPTYEQDRIQKNPELFTFIKKYEGFEYQIQLRYSGGMKDGFYFTIFKHFENHYEFLADWSNGRDDVVGSLPLVREILWEMIEVRKAKTQKAWNSVRIKYLIDYVFGTTSKTKQLYELGKKFKPYELYNAYKDLLTGNW